MTTTIVARGSEWSSITLYDNWGECGDGADVDATYKMLGDMVVARFEELTQENNIHAHWVPYTSEVIGNINQNLDERFPSGSYDDDDILTRLRKQAAGEIWDKWTNGDIDPVMEDTNV